MNLQTTTPRVRPVIRLFVSSTFSDMRHERNALQEEVFPKLEQLCSRNGFQFQAIDLRWGVSSEAGLDHRTMRICFDELRRAQEVSPRPNFLILLGNRYGWRPLPEEISVDEFHALEQAAGDLETTTDTSPGSILTDWYRQDKNAIPPVYLLQSRRQQLPDGRDYTQAGPWDEAQAVLWKIINRAMPPGELRRRFYEEALPANPPLPAVVRFQASATEQEIWQGALRVPDAQEHVIAFFRQIENIGESSDSARIRGFVDLDPSGNLDTDIAAEQERLKEELRTRLSPANLFEAKTARLVLREDNRDGTSADVTTDHLTQLCLDVESRMSEIIQGQIDGYWNQTTQASTKRTARELEIEQDEHTRFGRERGGAGSFVGRDTELQIIRDYLRNASPWPLVVHGSSGCGKTALLARVAEEEQSDETTPAEVLVRFIGVTPRSSDLRSLLGSLCQELRVRHPREGDLPTDINALREEFHEQLRCATPKRPIILILDALDQLSDADDGRLLHWIPLGALPEQVKLVISCLSDRPAGDPVGEPYAELRGRNIPTGNFVNLDALSELEAGTLLFERWLPQAGRTVNPDQRLRIEQRLASPLCRLPIFLKLLFEEVRLWPSYLIPPDLGEGVPALLAQLFARLSLPSNHGPLLVERVLGYLAASRQGLAENEILEILFRDPEYKQALDQATEQNRHELPASATRIPLAPWSRLRFDLAPYLSERAAPGTNVLTLYHRQVADWVAARFPKSTDETWEPHPLLAAYFRDLADPKTNQTWQGENLRSFQEIAFHLQGARRWDDLCTFLSDFRCLDRRIRFGQIFETINDQRAALEGLPELAENVRQDVERVETCRQYGKELIAYARDRREGKHPPLPRPPATEIPTARAASLGEVPSPRADRLRAISNFIIQQATLLANCPTEFLFLAANVADSGPLAEAADVIDASTLPWLRRDPRPPAPPLRSQCLQTLLGHTWDVASVSITPDGRRAASASRDKTLRVWDLRSGQCLHILEGHTADVNSVSITPDGRRAVSASRDETVRVWDLQSGLCLHVLEGHSGDVTSVSLTPDGQSAVSASRDETVRVWDLQGGLCLRVLKGHSGDVTSVSVTPDGQSAVSASNDHTLRVWNLRSGRCLRTLHGHTHGVLTVDIMPDGRNAVSSGNDPTLRVWDLQSGKCTQTFHGHTWAVSSVSLTPDGRRAVSASEDVFGSDKTLRVWDLLAGKCLQIIQGHTWDFTSVSVTPDGRRAVSASRDKTVRVWDLDLKTGQDFPTPSGHTRSIRCVSITPDGRRAVTASWDTTLRVWDLQSGLCLHVLEGHTWDVTSMSISRDGRRAVSSSQEPTLRVWDLQRGQCLHTLAGHGDSVRCVTVTPDDRRAVSASRDKTLRVWDILSGGCIYTLWGHTEEVLSVSVTPNGRSAVSASRDKTLRVWDLQTGRCLHTLSGHTGTVEAASITPDGKYAISAGDDTLRVWELQSGRCLQTLTEHTRGVRSVTVTPDGQHAISASYDQTLLLWSLRSGTRLHAFEGHTERVTSVRVSPEGRHVASASEDKTLRIWDLQSGECLAIYRAGDYHVESLAVSPMGERIVCGTLDGQVHFLTIRNFPPSTLPVSKPRKRWWHFWHGTPIQPKRNARGGD